MFKIAVTYFKNYPDCNTIDTVAHNYYGSFAAVHMGKEFASCPDVISVDVINKETGEILYYKLSSGETYEAAY